MESNSTDTRAALQDIRTTTLPAFQWDDENIVSSLEKLIERAISHADQAIVWYLRSKKAKRIGARLFRLGAILFIAAAGILPILQQIFTNEGKPPFSPAWASVLLSIAVLFVAIDRFFGFSTAWMRYITAELQIRQARESFELDWLSAHASFRGNTPTPEQVSAVIGMAKVFTDQLNTLISSETQKWVAEFQETLKQIDEGTKTSAQALQTCSLSIIVENGDQVDAPGWSLSIDQAPPSIYTGKTAALVGLSIGDHAVRVTGKIEQRLARAEAVASTRTGTIAALSLTLS
jgi:hypothetical protein